METTLIDLVAALAGAGAGASATFIYLKKKLAAVTDSLTIPEVLHIAFEFNKAVQANSPAGELLTDEEAEALGRAVWSAIKTKN